MVETMWSPLVLRKGKFCILMLLLLLCLTSVCVSAWDCEAGVCLPSLLRHRLGPGRGADPGRAAGRPVPACAWPGMGITVFKGCRCCQMQVYTMRCTTEPAVCLIIWVLCEAGPVPWLSGAAALMAPREDMGTTTVTVTDPTASPQVNWWLWGAGFSMCQAGGVEAELQGCVSLAGAFQPVTGWCWLLLLPRGVRHPQPCASLHCSLLRKLSSLRLCTCHRSCL